MRRRHVLTLIGSALIIPPLAAPAQQSAPRHRIAVVNAVDPVESIGETGPSPAWRAFFSELRRLGYVEGENIAVERYSAEGRNERQSALAQETIRHRPDVIVVTNNFTAKTYVDATSTIPIVAFTGQPVEDGLVPNLAHPGGNVTGVSSNPGLEIYPKRLQLLKEAIPSASKVGILAMPGDWDGTAVRTLRTASTQLGVALVEVPFEPTVAAEYDRLLQALPLRSPDALMVSGNPEFWTRRRDVVALVEKLRIPAMYEDVEFVREGGLMHYGSDLRAQWRRMADYVDKILRGTKPGDLPIEQATKYALAINLKAAKALGLAVPQVLLARADEVIE